MRVAVLFIKLISLQTIIIIALSCIATYLSLRFNVAVDLPTALIGIAIVFPIVFSINAAYKRREEALSHFASLKSNAVALYYAHRDWIPQENRNHSIRMKQLVERLLKTVHHCFTSRKDHDTYSKQIFSIFSETSGSLEKLRDAGVTTTEISRLNQYLRSMMIDFERMRNIYLYRTPTSLRVYSYVFLNSFPILFAPYFAYLSTQYFYGTGYFVAAFYALVLVGLDNIQEDLENPYDQIGEDDVHLDVAEYYSEILTD
jgi:predicted membrane chloride channel (bestrophin family)